MSARIKTLTPFINEELLCEALEILSIRYEKKYEKIILHEYKMYRETCFEKNGIGKFELHCESEISAQLEKLKKKIAQQYNIASERIEKETLVKEREEFIKKQRKAILEKAKLEGYSVKEKKKDGKIHLILERVKYS